MDIWNIILRYRTRECGKKVKNTHSRGGKNINTIEMRFFPVVRVHVKIFKGGAREKKIKIDEAFFA